MRVDPRVPLGVAPGHRRAVARYRTGASAGSRPSAYAGLAGPGAAQDQDGRYGFAPRCTRGLGIRSFRGWLARVNAYQPVPRALTSSFGNRSRAFLVVVSPS